jgi:hypothetical protein
LLESTTRSQVLARFGSTLLARISNADVRSSSLSRPHLRNIHCRSRIRGHIGDRGVSEDRYKSTTRAWNWAPVLSRGLPLPARASSDGQCSQQRQREPGRRPIPAQTEAVDNIQWAELIGPLAGEAGLLSRLRANATTTGGVAQVCPTSSPSYRSTRSWSSGPSSRPAAPWRGRSGVTTGALSPGRHSSAQSRGHSWAMQSKAPAGRPRAPARRRRR